MQSTISPTPRSFPGYPQDAATASIQRSAADFAGIFVLLLLAFLVMGTISWQFWHVNRIYGGVAIAQVAVGGMTRAQALQALETRVTGQASPAVSLTYGEQQWPLPAETLHGTPDLLAAVNQAYSVGRQPNLMMRLGQQLVALLGGMNIQPPLTFDQSRIQQAVVGIAAEAHQPGRPARRLGDVTLPAEPEVVVDIGATTETLWRLLQAETRPPFIQVPLVVTESQLAATATGGSDSAVAGESSTTSAAIETLRRPLRLVDARYGLHFALDPILLAAFTRTNQPATLDEAAVRSYLEGLAAQINIEPRNARLRFNPETGGVTVLQTSHTGRQLDIEGTIAALQQALATEAEQAALLISPVAPAVDSNRIAEMGIRELVASGTSYFRGSSAERVHNIVIAAEKFDGLVIPPSEIFSFNQGVEDVSSANGFEDSLIILGDTTAVGVGGGVCQVSTTVFRAAYNGGFDIVERYNHGYVVSWYGDPGLDATIYTPTVDFRFRNNTNAYLLIEPVVNTTSGVITFNFYGTKPNRDVQVGVPQRRDVIEPEEPLYVVNEELAAGQIVQKEWEQKGMTVSVERTITENGTTRTDTLTSVYQPWQAVYEMGPGTQIELTPTPTPVPSDGLLNPNIALTPTPSSPDSGP